MVYNQLIDAQPFLDEVKHNPLASEVGNLTARINLALREMESAHLIIYQQMAEMNIRAEIASKKVESSKIKKNENIINNLESLIYINSRQNERRVSYISKIINDEPERKADPDEAHIINASWNFANNAVQHDGGLKRFRQQLLELQQKGEKTTLDALLDASHRVATSASTSAQDFLTTLGSIPATDIIAYTTAVTTLFPDQTSGMNGNPLMTRLSMISPRVEKDDPFLLSRKIKYDEFGGYTGLRIKEPENYFLNESKKIRFYDKNFSEPETYIFSNLARPKFDISLLSLKSEYSAFGLDSGFDKFNIYDIDLKSHGGNENTSLFSEIQEVYRQAGVEVGGAWLRHVNELFQSEWSKGREFALKSRPTVVAYQKSLGLDLDMLIADYSTLGKELFSIPTFTDKYVDLPSERKRSLLRSHLDTNQLNAINELTNNAMHRRAVSFVYSSLPSSVSDVDLISAFNETAKLYSLCKSSNINERLIETHLFAIPKVAGINEFVEWANRTESRARQYIEFADKQRKNANMNLGFNDLSAQHTLELYDGFLGKSFVQFERDFEATGNDFQKLPDIKKGYEKFLDETQLKAFLNYVGKQRNRDLIKDLMNKAPDELVSGVVSKLGDKAGKREFVKAFAELNRTHSFLKTVGAVEFLEKRLAAIHNDAGYDIIFNAIASSRKEYFSVVTDGKAVPRSLEDSVGNIVIGYSQNSGTLYGVEIRPALKLITSAYLEKGADGARAAISGLDGNKSLEKRLKKQGIDIHAFKTGIKQTYELATDEGSLQRSKEKIDAEVDQIFNRLKQLELEEDELNSLKEGSLREQLDSVEKFLGTYKFTKKTKPLKLEIKGHIQTARSITGTLKEMKADTLFYVSQDPIESLHMGQYFDSCLSLSKTYGGCNGWASVVQTVDLNKNVIYAKTEDGKYVGRNRTALTDKGILCTRFYQNGNMNLNNAWVDYLGNFANHTKQDVMIPTTFTPQSMSSLLENMVSQGKATKEIRSVQIEPAHFNAFYGDGLTTKKTLLGKIEVNAEVYVLKPQLPTTINPVIQQQESYITKIAKQVIGG